MGGFKRLRKNQSDAYNRKGRNSFGRGDWEEDDDDDFDFGNEERETEDDEGLRQESSR